VVYQREQAKERSTASEPKPGPDMVDLLPDIYGLSREAGQSLAFQESRVVAGSPQAKTNDAGDYKPTDEKLKSALASADPAKELATIADGLAEVKSGKETGFNYPAFRKTLEEYILKGGLPAAIEFAKKTGPNYTVDVNVGAEDRAITLHFQPKTGADTKDRPGVALADDLIIDRREKGAGELAARCANAVDNTGPGRGLNDPTLREAINEFVGKNYLEGKVPDISALQKQFAGKIGRNCHVQLPDPPLNAEYEGIDLRFSRVDKDGKLERIADIPARPFSSQTTSAETVGKAFKEAWGNPNQLQKAMIKLQEAFESEIGQAGMLESAERRCRGLVAKINEANPNGRLKLPQGHILKLSPISNTGMRIRVQYEPIESRELKLGVE
jgi:hypothetical protein